MTEQMFQLSAAAFDPSLVYSMTNGDDRVFTTIMSGWAQASLEGWWDWWDIASISGVSA